MYKTLATANLLFLPFNSYIVQFVATFTLLASFPCGTEFCMLQSSPVSDDGEEGNGVASRSFV
jgi:hypothetical protein